MRRDDRPVDPAPARPAAAVVLLGFLLALVTIASAAAGAAPDTGMPLGATEPRRINVLLVYTEPRLGPAVVSLDEAFRSTLESSVQGPVFFYTEYLDLSLFVGNLPQRELRDLLVRKYAGRHLDLVLAVGSRALRIVSQTRSILFPGVPVVFTAVDPTAIADTKLDPDVTGTWLRLGWARTLDAALRLQPHARRAVIVVGTGLPDRVWLAQAKAQLAPYQKRIEISYLTDLPFADVLKRVGALDRDTVLLLGVFSRDADNRDFVGAQVAGVLSRAASVPAYNLNESAIGTGVVGGDVVRFRAHGALAAELAARVLRGQRPTSTAEGTNAYVFDWRQLQRWSIDERRLPPDSVVQFREPSVWDLYKWYILGGTALLVAQTALIAGLLVTHRLRRHAQRMLSERLRFETLLSELSTTLLMLPTSDVDRMVESMLKRVGEELDFDRALLTEQDQRTGGRQVTHSWTRAGVAPPTVLASNISPWIGGRLLAGFVVQFSRLEELPPEAEADRRRLESLGLRSLAIFPLVVGGSVVGTLGFTRFSGDRAWPDELVPRLQLLADVFANVLARRQADNAVQESDERRRHAEVQLGRHRDELAHALRVATLGELTASIAHEVNQPLAAIVMNAKAVSRMLEAERAAPHEMAEACKDIAADAQRAGSTIGRLRTLFRKADAELSPVDANALIHDAVRLLRRDMEDRRILIRLALAEALPSVLGDPIQLQQVVLNLLMNARDAMTGAESVPHVIQIETSWPASKRLAITVRDNGIGVKNEVELERMFEHFVSSKPQGLGLGLAISRSIVEAHGGQIWATRNDKAGLTVHVELAVPTGTEPSAASPDGRDRSLISSPKS
jgi:C4-dicarboxylate-specific signal transduction histidine kinase